MTSPTSSFGATRHGRTRGDASWINDNSTQMPVWLTMNARDARRAMPHAMPPSHLSW